MGQKTVRFSDLSGQLIMHDDALARIVVHEHPELGDGPVEIEALTEEAEAMEETALRVAVIDLYLPDDIEPRRIVLEADAFDKLATQSSMEELLTAARPVRREMRIPLLSLGYCSKATSRICRTLSAGGQFWNVMVPLNPESAVGGSNPLSHPESMSGMDTRSNGTHVRRSIITARPRQ